MPITFLTTEEERKAVKQSDLTIDCDVLGLDYIMEKSEERAGRRLN